MRYVKKADIIYITALVFAILGFVAVLFFVSYKHNSDKVIIEVAGEVYGEYSLYEDRIIEINELGHNIVVIENGTVYMEHADCPDQVCVEHYAIRSNLGTIVCLPNQVIVYLDAENYSEVDVMS
ncbi:MAG: NusG domain II-containing protein [Clostridia bacterium]